MEALGGGGDRRSEAAWCDPAETVIACCPPGLAATGVDRLCACPPGGTDVLAIAKLLGRIEALKEAPEREATRKADHEALATLAKRKLDDKLWNRLGVLVQRAKHPDLPAAVETAPIAAEAAEATAVAPDPFREALLALTVFGSTALTLDVSSGLLRFWLKESLCANVDGTPTPPEFIVEGEFGMHG